jgi:uncharacterized protein (TIGR02996 family)
LLADVIDGWEPPVRHFPSNAKAVVWAEAALLYPADEDLPAILQAAYQSRSTSDATRIVQGLLDHWPDDPRLTTTFSRWMQRPPWTGSGSRTVWGRVHKLLMRTADARAAKLAELNVTALFGGTTGDWWVKKLVRLRGRTYAAPAATAIEQEGWASTLAARARLEERRHIARTTAEALFGAVYAEPEDASLRSILADALNELDDPRGEFIQLQLQPASKRVTRRQRALTKLHGANWAGPLDRVLLKGGRVWRQGFLTAGRLRAKSPHDEEQAMGCLAWRLFERLEMASSIQQFTTASRLLATADLCRLHTMTGIQFGFELRAVIEAQAPLRRLELVSSPLDVSTWGHRVRPPDRPRRVEQVRVDRSWLLEAERLVTLLDIGRLEVPLAAAWAPGDDPVAAVRPLLGRLTLLADQVVVVASAEHVRVLRAAGIACSR